MSGTIDKYYYPTERVLEDYSNSQLIQTQFGDCDNEDDVFEIIKSRVAKKRVNVRDSKTDVVKTEDRWISLYRITLGDRPTFNAGIISNYEPSTNAGAYRILNDSDHAMEIVFDDK